MMGASGWVRKVRSTALASSSTALQTAFSRPSKALAWMPMASLDRGPLAGHGLAEQRVESFGVFGDAALAARVGHL